MLDCDRVATGVDPRTGTGVAWLPHGTVHVTVLPVADGAGTTVAFTTQADTPTAGITTVTATVNGTATSKLFVRVNATQN